MSAIAPPAAFGSLYKSTTPEALDSILRELDLASLEQEQFRLERAIQALVKSNKEIQEFIELEQQEQEQEGIVPNPDPEFVLAIEENVQVIRKYEATCAALKRIIREKRGGQVGDEQDISCASQGPGIGSSSVLPTESSGSTELSSASTTTATIATTTISEADNDDDGVYL
ncbi:hypothetical protein CPC16_007923 [Podila verticillata]|nr:hypothetical protein CPC16_007923 [Podila verticillata]